VYIREELVLFTDTITDPERQMFTIFPDSKGGSVDTDSWPTAGLTDAIRINPERVKKRFLIAGISPDVK
jgi:hypothetical protein